MVQEKLSDRNATLAVCTACLVVLVLAVPFYWSSRLAAPEDHAPPTSMQPLAPKPEMSSGEILLRRQSLDGALGSAPSPHGAGNGSSDMPQVPALFGRVIDGEGRPIHGAAVAVQGGIWDGSKLRADAISDESGAYRCRLGVAKPGHEIVVMASCAGFQPDKKTVVLGGGGLQELNWELHSGNGLYGRVVSRGASVVGAFATMVGRYTDGSIRTASDRALADGRFAIGFHSVVRAEKVVVFQGQLGVAERLCQDFPIGGDIGDIELLPRDPLSAQLVDGSGQPLSGFGITVLRTEGNDLDGGVGGCFWDPTTDSGGSFVLYGMRAGRFHVFVGGTEVSGFSEPVGQIETGAAQQTITVPGTRVRVRALRGEADYPPAERRVSWYRQVKGVWKSDGLASRLDRLVEQGSVWRVDLVRLGDESVAASQIIDTGTRTCIDVVLRATP